MGLAAVLLRGPDLLLLDEPTNHLDFQALRWLEDFLLDAREGRGSGGRGGGSQASALGGRRGSRPARRKAGRAGDRGRFPRPGLPRSHGDVHRGDRRAPAGRPRVPGRYSAFLAAKQRERAQWEEAYAREQAEIKALREAVRESARRVGTPTGPRRTRTSTPSSSSPSRCSAPSPATCAPPRRSCAGSRPTPCCARPSPCACARSSTSTPPTGRTPLLARGLVRRYGGRDGAAGASTWPWSQAAGRDQRAQRGRQVHPPAPPGGTGGPDEGTVSLAPSVVVGYLEQEPGTRADEPAEPAETLFEAYRRGLLGLEGALRADLVRHGFFRHQDLDRRVRDLSAGQQRKLQLARLVATGPICCSWTSRPTTWTSPPWRRSRRPCRAPRAGPGRLPRPALHRALGGQAWGAGGRPPPPARAREPSGRGARTPPLGALASAAAPLPGSVAPPLDPGGGPSSTRNPLGARPRRGTRYSACERLQPGAPPKRAGEIEAHPASGRLNPDPDHRRAHAQSGRPVVARTVLVTGATGNVGAELVRLLAQQGTAVRASRHPPPEAPPPGVERVRFDLRDQATYEDAFAGVDRLFLLRPPDVSNVRRDVRPCCSRPPGGRAACGLPLPPGGRAEPLPAPPAHRALDRAHRGPLHLPAGQLLHAEPEHHAPGGDQGAGEIFVPAGRGRTSFIDARDVAAVAAVALGGGGPRRPRLPPHGGPGAGLLPGGAHPHRGAGPAGVLPRPVRAALRGAGLSAGGRRCPSWWSWPRSTPPPAWASRPP